VLFGRGEGVVVKVIDDKGGTILRDVDVEFEEEGNDA